MGVRANGVGTTQLPRRDGSPTATRSARSAVPVSIRVGVEESRERLVALTLLLQRATRQRPLTQEAIVAELLIDEYPVDKKAPRRVRAYRGSETAVRQKFERDKAKVRELGIQIETTALGDGTVGYWIDPDGANGPAIDFDDAERRVVGLALHLYGFGPSGAFSLFNEGPAPEGGLEFSNYYNPILRSLRLGRVLVFDYQSSANKTRTVEPLAVGVFDGAAYLVARVRGSDEVKGYRITRMTSMPLVLGEPFNVDDATRELAASWRPQYARTPRPVDTVVVTSANYARLLTQQYPGSLAAQRKGGQVEVGLSFDNLREAMRFALNAGPRVRVTSPKLLKNELASWLRGVNRGDVAPLDELRFEPHATNDALGQALQLLHAVHLAEGGLRISELSRRFTLSADVVRHVMDRMVSFEPFHGRYGFPAHVIKECDDWEDEANDDSLYRAEFGPSHERTTPSLTWRDLFELNIALREASRVFDVPAMHSAIEKIEAVVGTRVRVESAAPEASLADVRAAIEGRERIKIHYVPGYSDELQERTIEPRELRVLNGRAYVRAYCLTREAWRTFRVDRISGVVAKSPADAVRPEDPTVNWLTEVGEGGVDVVVILEPGLRWIFEPLPSAQWQPLRDGRHAVRFRVAEPTFLDHLMVQAGPGAVVASPDFADAGRELARRMLQAL